MRTFIFLALLLSIAGCSSLPLSEDNYFEVKKAIAQNDTDKVKSLLEDRKDLSSYSFFLDDAVEQCQPEIAMFLLEHGAIPTDKASEVELPAVSLSPKKALGDSKACEKNCIERRPDLETAVVNLCPSVVEILLPKVTLSDVEKRSSEFLSKMEKHGAEKQGGEDDGDREERVKAVYSLLKMKIYDVCRMTSAACDLWAKFENHDKQEAARIAEAKEKQEEEERRNDVNIQRQEAEDRLMASSDAIKREACEARSQIRFADEQMRFQRRIGNESGYVRKDVLYQMGMLKLLYRDRMQALIAKYRRRTGRDLNLGDCKRLCAIGNTAENFSFCHDTRKPASGE